MLWRPAHPTDAPGVHRLMLDPRIVRLTTIAGVNDAAARAMAVRAVMLDVALVLDDDGVRGWLGSAGVGDGVSEVSGLMDVARYGVMPSVTIARDGLRALNPLVVGIPIAIVHPSNTFAVRCLAGMGILIAHTDTKTATKGLDLWRKTRSHP